VSGVVEIAIGVACILLGVLLLPLRKRAKNTRRHYDTIDEGDGVKTFVYRDASWGGTVNPWREFGKRWDGIMLIAVGIAAVLLGLFRELQ
jgi:uncharacterized membrane protein